MNGFWVRSLRATLGSCVEDNNIKPAIKVGFLDWEAWFNAVRRKKEP